MNGQCATGMGQVGATAAREASTQAWKHANLQKEGKCREQLKREPFANSLPPAWNVLVSSESLGEG